MGRRCLPLATIAGFALLLAQMGGSHPAGAQPAGPPAALIKLPAMGRAGAAIAPLQKALEAAGFRTTVSLATAPISAVTPRPTVVVTYQTEIADDAEAAYVRDAVKRGSGLVYLFGSASERVGAANAFLKESGMQIAPAPREGRNVVIVAPEVIPGVGEAPAPRIGLHLAGAGVNAFGVQAKHTLVAGVAFGKGRIAALPLDVLAGERASEAPPAATLAVLVGCARWSAGQGPVAAPPVVTSQQPPGGKPTGPTGSKPIAPVALEAAAQVFAAADDFKARTLVDLGANDDGWLIIAQQLATALPPEAAAAALKTLGLPDPLVAALKTGPALAIIGSCREFSDAESIALAEYVGSGGRALVLARATDPTVPRLIALNNLLFGFDVLAVLGRPAGAVALAKHPAVEGVTGLSPVTAGVRFASGKATPVASVGGAALALAGEAGTGRFVVLDATPMIGGKDPKANAARDAFMSLVRCALTWLTQK